MAEDTLVKDVLTDRMIAAGEALTTTLEQRGWPFVAAFWLYDWETNRWRLVVASPVMDKDTKAGVSEVFAALDATTPKVQFTDVYVVSPKDRYVRELLELVERGFNIDGERVRSGSVEDSWVYRVRPAAAA